MLMSASATPIDSSVPSASSSPRRHLAAANYGCESEAGEQQALSAAGSNSEKLQRVLLETKRFCAPRAPNPRPIWRVRRAKPSCTGDRGVDLAALACSEPGPPAIRTLALCDRAAKRLPDQRALNLFSRKPFQSFERGCGVEGHVGVISRLGGSRPSESTRCPSRRSPGWPRISTSTSTSSAIDHWAMRDRSRLSPPMLSR